MWRQVLYWKSWLLAVLLLTPPVLAQEAGTVTLTQPPPGAVLTGVVVLNGTATHPGFVRYELAFALDADPTNTWFSIQEAVNAPVVAGPLGSWDTRGIVDGNYAVRLRMYTAERNFVEAVVRGLRVQNTTPTATPLAAVTPSPSGPTPTLPPTVTAVVIAAIATPVPRPAANPLGEALAPFMSLTSVQINLAFWSGVRLSALFFGILGLYALWRWWWRRFIQS
jgi:hypothetical protein